MSERRGRAPVCTRQSLVEAAFAIVKPGRLSRARHAVSRLSQEPRDRRCSASGTSITACTGMAGTSSSSAYATLRRNWSQCRGLHGRARSCYYGRVPWLWKNMICVAPETRRMTSDDHAVAADLQRGAEHRADVEPAVVGQGHRRRRQLQHGCHARDRGAAIPASACFSVAFTTHAEQWNFGLQETGITTEWVLALDADFVLSDELIGEIGSLTPDAGTAGYRASFTYCIDGQPLTGGGLSPVVVLFRRASARYGKTATRNACSSTGRSERWPAGSATTTASRSRTGCRRNRVTCGSRPRSSARRRRVR